MLHDPRFTTDRGRKTNVSWGRKRKKEIITTGAIPIDGDGFVYVGESPTGRVKIGMSSQPSQRCAKMGIELRHAEPVRPQMAKEVETAALQRLGHEQGDGEWLRKPDVLAAVEAVIYAMAQLRRRFWIDPRLTEDEARKLRVRLAVDEAAERAILTAPDRRNRSISITSHRKATGITGAYGSRFG